MSGSAIDVVAENADLPGALAHERGDDADEGGLAGAVGPEQGEEVAGGDIQIDALQGLHAILISLRQTSDAKRIHNKGLKQGLAAPSVAHAAILPAALPQERPRAEGKRYECGRRKTLVTPASRRMRLCQIS